MQKPDWALWFKMPKAELWECVLLSLGIAPENLDPECAQFIARFNGIPSAKSRLRLLQESLPPQIKQYFTFAELDYEENHRSKIKLPQFAAWAVSIAQWEHLPSELESLASACKPQPSGERISDMGATKIQRFVDLLDHVEQLSIREILNVAVLGRHPLKSVDVTPEDTARLQELRASSEKKLKLAIQKREVQPLDPQTMCPQESWNKESLVPREQFTQFFATIGIEVRKMLEFITSARPLCVDPALLALDASAGIAYQENIGVTKSNGRCCAGDYRAEIEARIKRQERGLFTLDEAAQLFSDAYGHDIKKTIADMLHARIEARALVRDSATERPLDSVVERFYFRYLVKVDDVDAWLESLGVDYRFPPAAPAETTLVIETAAQANVGGTLCQTSGLGKREKQIRAIEAIADKLEYKRLAILDGQKKTIEAECKKAHLQLFGVSPDPFKRAWQAAVKQDRMKMQQHAKYAKR